jgi:hypothetical protein
MLSRPYNHEFLMRKVPDVIILYKILDKDGGHWTDRRSRQLHRRLAADKAV